MLCCPGSTHPLHLKPIGAGTRTVNFRQDPKITSSRDLLPEHSWKEMETDHGWAQSKTRQTTQGFLFGAKAACSLT